ncbi:DNA polymerase delta subunit 4 [Gracilaria domingensis]|nr:DNA polymerase delta subunit 4 [Gracilaria domingensis]
MAEDGDKRSPDAANSCSDTSIIMHSRSGADAGNSNAQPWTRAACEETTTTSAATQQRLRGSCSVNQRECALKRFDMNDKYGPRSGVKRITRLHRAIRFGIKVEQRLREAVQREEEEARKRHQESADAVRM